MCTTCSQGSERPCAMPVTWQATEQHVHRGAAVRQAQPCQMQGQSVLICIGLSI